MTHSFIEASQRYLKAQAKVIRDAEDWVDGGSRQVLVDAIKELREARYEYLQQKSKASSEGS